MVLDPPPFLPSTKSAYLQGGDATAFDEEDLYSRLKSLVRQLEFVDIQEEYVKDELKNLRRELLRAMEEVKRIQSVPLVIGQKQNNVGSNYYARILNTINRELLKPSAFVVLHCHSNVLVDMATLHDDFPHGGGVGTLHRDSIDHLLPVGGLEVGAVGVDEGRMAEGDAGKGRGRRREVGNHFIFLK